MWSSTSLAIVLPVLLVAPQALLSSSILVNAAPTPETRGVCAAPNGHNLQVEWTPDPGEGPRRDTPVIVDVAIVGGGFSGMAAAYQLHQAGLKVVVLEATDVLGGRSRSHQLETGPGLVELGATWINNKTQPAVTALAKDFGLELIEQYTEGYEVRQMLDGTVALQGGEEDEEEANEDLDPEVAEAAALLTDFINAVTVAEMQIDLEVFDEFPVEQDVSFEDWILRNESWDHPIIHANARQLTTAIVGREPNDTGAHYWFDYLRSGRGLESLLGDEADGAQQLMVKTGTTSIVTSIRDAMPEDSVLTKEPVTNIKQNEDRISLVTKSGKTVEAKKAILAIMPSTYSKIEFSPALPEDKQGLVAASQEGLYAKVLVTYAAPWWRNANLTGQFFSYTGPITYSLETSVPSLEQYSLATFVGGDFAVEWFKLSDDEKREAVVEHLATMAGAVAGELAPFARDYLEINYVAWTNEEYIGGGPTNVMGPGMLRKYGETLRQSVGDMHFAGTETAYEWKGYLDGAVTAGRRAADEVFEALGGGKQ